jgi:beta-aspartyl-peptidase (threonine type)
MEHPIAIALHGGAGNLKKLKLTKEEEAAYEAIIQFALNAGYGVLKNGGTSVDAVETTIKILEDSPLFNAGKGAVFTHDGTVELDAAIMDGSDFSCGGITGAMHIKNPISAAKSVMRNSEFVLLSGSGADEFAKEQGLEYVEQSYFFTQKRWDQLQEALKEDSVSLDHEKPQSSSSTNSPEEKKYGTVGCVAMDSNGNLAAGTSTGGLVNKRYHRIGDSPIIGAGTYADNNSCAVSCTGKGEDFMRLSVAHEISAQLKYTGASLDSCVSNVMHKQLKSVKGRGGCIVIDKNGNICMDFTTTGMFRGSIDKNGKLEVAIYKKE